MEENEKTRILNMVKEGKITVEEAGHLLDALNQKAGQPDEIITLKDNRGRKAKKLKVQVDSGDSGDAKVSINLPISLVRTVGPIVAKNMPAEAKQQLEDKGVDLNQIFADIDNLAESGLEEDIVNIDAGKDGHNAKVRVFFE
jgi:hypothetical protein